MHPRYLIVLAAVLAVACLAIWRTTDQLPTPTPAISQTPFAPLFPQPPSTQPTVRVAVIGGMFETGLWPSLADRYEKATGVHIQLVAAGTKDTLDKTFKELHGVDLITMHSNDTIVNLVADGYATDPQPWMKNDLIIVGPPEDPAGIQGMTDAAAALKKIADAHSPFVVHASLGAQEVLRAILERNNITLAPDKLTILFTDAARNVLKIAADKHAYSMVGRIPFLTGKLVNAGLILMVRGDERLRRPYLVAIANPARVPDVHLADAQHFAAYLRAPETQSWIATFGIGKIDDQPLFFPITLAPATQPSTTPN